MPNLLNKMPVLEAMTIAAASFSSTPSIAQDTDHIIVGAGAAVLPSYQGAKDYRVTPLPAIDVRQGMVFANTRDGIGVAPLDDEHVTIGVGAVFMQGYRRRDVPAHIHKLSDGVGARAFVNLRTGGFVATLGVTQGITGQTRGVIADASVTYPIIVTEKLSVAPNISTTWANAKYNDRYFGVDTSEAMRSGLDRYVARSGFKDVSGTITAVYSLDKHVSLAATGGVVTLVGEAKGSPLVERQTRPIGIFSVGYRF